jgi:Cdc6-like AAA superfamily ATPase
VTTSEASELVERMSERLNLVRLDHHVKERSDGPYLVIEVAEPAERLFRALRESQATLPENNPFRERATIAVRPKVSPNRLRLPETQLLKATLSESLTADRNAFRGDFSGRYIRSVFGLEDQIASAGNHVVYGRRGSGKSSLLAYAMHQRRKVSAPYAWIDMQAYAGRGDIQVSVDVIVDILDQLSSSGPESDATTTLRALRESTEELTTKTDDAAQRELERMLPRIKRAVARLAETRADVSVFLDDFHVVQEEEQPQLLARLYSIARGSRCHLKVSGIEHFTRTWDSAKNRGLQPPHDAQILKLDHNLTMPDKSRDHIQSILDAHAKFCGLPSVAYISGDGVLSRLVWVAAAVPRDALNLFAQAITKATAQDQRRVSITSVNAAASEMAEQKLRDMQQDAHSDDQQLKVVLESIKVFCVNTKKKNAFLLEISNEDSLYRSVQELIALRFVHVLHEGITPHEAGRRYQALMLDYGFYVGIRAARSVDQFQSEPKAPTVQELRKLPIFSSAE